MRTQHSILHTERGVGALLVVVVLGGVLLLIASASSRTGIGQLTRHLGSIGIFQARSIAEGCKDEQLRAFVRSPGDTGGSLTVENGTCIITVTGGVTKDVLVFANTTDGYTTALRFFATVNGNAPAVVDLLRSTYIPVP